MSKSDQTRQRHAKAFRGQRQLTGFGFKAPSYPARVLGPKMKAVANPSSPVSIMQDIEPEAQLTQVAQPHSSMSVDAPSQMGRLARTRSATVLSDPSTDSDDEAVPVDVPENDKFESSSAENLNDEDIEDWEADLDESVQGPKAHVRDWTDLRKQIKDHL